MVQAKALEFALGDERRRFFHHLGLGVDSTGLGPKSWVQTRIETAVAQLSAEFEKARGWTIESKGETNEDFSRVPRLSWRHREESMGNYHGWELGEGGRVGERLESNEGKAMNVEGLKRDFVPLQQYFFTKIYI